MSIKGRYNYHATGQLEDFLKLDLEPEQIAEVKAELSCRQAKGASRDDTVGFGWWDFQGWAGLVLGPLAIANSLSHVPAAAWTMIAINTMFAVMIIRYNKLFFLVGTVLSCNPILWIINGFYLRRRWDHPQINGGKVKEGK
jgi:hypothetical protein